MRCLTISLLTECQPSRGFIFVGIMNWFRRIPSFWHSANLFFRTPLRLGISRYPLYLLFLIQFGVLNVTVIDTEKTLVVAKWHVLDVVKLTTRAKHVTIPFLVPIARAATLLTPESVQGGNKNNMYNKLSRVEKQVSFPEAQRLVETMSGAVAGKSYATAVNVSTTNASVQTDLTWPNGADRFINKYLKARKQATKAAQKQ